ncbi:MAG: hypothetical protein B7Z75_12985 [Acidocella sp. 20-57-95]|nr:MAG: hypothetical protein B7Z75_12985 [Acidocella sp. 20-57-95]
MSHKLKIPKIFAALAAILCVGLTGCYSDPFQNPGQWSMNSAPRENLATQTADKTELFQGHGESQSNGVAAAAGVDVALGGGTASGLQKPPKDITFSSGTGN